MWGAGGCQPSEGFGRRGAAGGAFRVCLLLFPAKTLSNGICQKDGLCVEKDYAESPSESSEAVTLATCFGLRSLSPQGTIVGKYQETEGVQNTPQVSL